MPSLAFPVYTGRVLRAAWFNLFFIWWFYLLVLFFLLPVISPLTPAGKISIAPGEARGSGFPQRKKRCTRRWLREPHGRCSAIFTV